MSNFIDISVHESIVKTTLFGDIHWVMYDDIEDLCNNIEDLSMKQIIGRFTNIYKVNPEPFPVRPNKISFLYDITKKTTFDHPDSLKMTYADGMEYEELNVCFRENPSIILHWINSNSLTFSMNMGRASKWYEPRAQNILDELLQESLQ
jgi:hypothetical protein